MKCKYDECKNCNLKCKHYANVGSLILCSYLKTWFKKEI